MSDRIEQAAAALSGAVEKAGLLGGGSRSRSRWVQGMANASGNRRGRLARAAAYLSQRKKGGALPISRGDQANFALWRLGYKTAKTPPVQRTGIYKNMMRGGSGGMHVRLAMVNGSKIKGGTPRLLRAAKYLQARVKRPAFQAAHTARIAQRTAFAAARIGKSKAKTLYVYRPVTNADEIIAWAKGQGFATTLAPADLHVTIAYSKTPMNWARLSDDWRRDYNSPDGVEGPSLSSGYGYGGDTDPKARTISGGVREVKALGKDGAVVLAFESVALTQRWADLRAAGAGTSYPSFTPHLTITYQPGKVDLSKVSPYSGPIQLGDECWEEIRPNAQDDLEEV